MSHSNPPEPNPTPLEAEAYLEESSAQTIDVDATESTEEVDFSTAIAATFPHPEDSADGFLLARKLRQHNRELVKTVVQLEQALAESQERLQQQITRARSADSLINQQADNLNGTQAEIETLKESLAIAKQEVRDHQAMISELNNKLRRSQTQLGRVERECTILQESYNEQQQKLIAAEQEIQDLQTRLQRQQQYALEYKTALEAQKSEQTQAPVVEIHQPKPTKAMPKVQRIQPWSEQTPAPKPFIAAVPDFTDETVPASPEPTFNPATNVNNGAIAEDVFQPPSQPQDPLQLQRTHSVPQPEAATPENTVILPPEVNEDLEEQLRALEVEMEEMAKQAEAPQVPPATTIQFPSFIATQGKVARSQPSAEMPQNRVQPPLANQKNWPSPTLNPLRSAKKRSSIAAVELPTFPRR